MTVRFKTLATVSVTLAVAMAAMYLGASRVLIHSYREIERQDTRKDIQRVMDALEREHSGIALVAADYAAWDQTYEFVLQPNATFIEENCGTESLTNLGNNLVAYVRLDGTIAWATGYNPDKGERTPLPVGFSRWVRPGGRLQQRPESRYPVRGLIQFPEGPMLVVSHPILKSNCTGPARGAMILGRRLDSDMVEQLCRLTHLQVAIQPYDGSNLPAPFATAREVLVRQTEPYLHPLSADTMAGYSLIRDIEGRPALIVQVLLPRENYQQGLRTTRILLVSLFAAGIALIGMLFLVLEKVVLRPILHLGRDVDSVRASGDASQRVDVSGNDEVTCLAITVNEMLDSLDRSHRKQVQSESMFRQMALNASDALFTVHPHTGRVAWYGDITGLLGLDAADLPLTVTAWLEFVHPDDREPALAAIRAARMTGAPLHIEHRIRHADGGWRNWVTRSRWIETDELERDDAESGHLRSAEAGAVESVPAGAWLIGACKDITEPRQREEALRESEERLARIVETNADGILLLDRERRITLANPAVESIFGATREEFVQRMAGPEEWGMVGPNGQPLKEDECPFASVIRTGQPIREAEVSVLHGSGRRTLVSINAAPLHDSAGMVTGVAVSVCDITERKTLEERLTYQAFHDPLTNLPNRALFQDRLSKALSRCERTGRGVCVLFLDLDNFKLINDSLGHDMGDLLLSQVARRLAMSLRDCDTAARFGGDEFTVLAEDLAGMEDAMTLAGRILDRLNQPFLLGTREVYVSPSIGVAMSGLEDITADELLRNADAAMYEAKSKGKARIEVFHSRLNAHALTRLQMEYGLRRALDLGELEVHYQPKVSIPTGAVISMEALVRWRHPERGLIPPADFVPLAEQTSLITPIGRFVLNEACREARGWHRQFPDQPPLSVSVNLSARQFEHPDLVTDVADALRKWDLEPRHLILEITESVLMNEAEATIHTLNALKGLGVRLAIDDFGTGYSSLSYLKRFPMDFVKIDRSFVSGLGSDSEDTVIVSATVSLAHALGLTVVAEGAETMAQVDHLRSIGCDQAQGYLFARAMLPSEVPTYLADSLCVAPMYETVEGTVT